MRKLLLIILVVAAVGVYTYDAFLLVKPAATRKAVAAKKSGEQVSVENLLARSQPVRFVKSDRNPFLPRSEKNEADLRVTRSAVKPSAPASLVDAPKITISGIMWDPASPLAMIVLPDGSSAAVKAGQTIGDITVKKIEKERVCIVFQKKTFWITR
jgi:hypothetical protein